MSFPLYLCSTDNRPLLGRFNESELIALDNEELVQKPIKLYSKQEEIKEDEEEEDIVKDSAYWAKRKKSRRKYQAKKQYFLEDSSLSLSTGKPSFRYEGDIADVNMQISDTVDVPEEDRELFRYAILQVTTRSAVDVATSSAASTAATGGPKVKPMGSGSSATSAQAAAQAQQQQVRVVNIIPVGDWVNFRKPSAKSSDVFLEQVDEAIEDAAKAREKANKKYKAIANALSRDQVQVEGAAEIHGKNKPKGGSRRKLVDSLRDVIDGGDEDDGYGHEETMASHDTAGAGAGNGTGSRLFARGEDDDDGAGTAARERQENIDDGDVDFTEHFDDNDVLEAVAEEEEYLESVEQASKSQKKLVHSGDYISVGWGEDERVLDGDGDIDSEDSDAEDEELEGLHGGAGGEGGGESGGWAAGAVPGSTGRGQGLLSAAKMEKMSSYVRELKWHESNKGADGRAQALQQAQQLARAQAQAQKQGMAAAAAAASASSSSGSGSSSGIMKRPASQLDGGAGGDNNLAMGGKRVKVESPPINPLTGRPGNKSASPPLGGGGRQGDAAITTFELTDAGVKAYIRYRGGKVKVDELARALKKQIKAAGEQGRATFMDIVKRTTRTIDDPVLGRVLALPLML